MATMMKCGCAATAKTVPEGNPVCVVHACKDAAESEPDLTGRTARCTYRKGPGCEANASRSRQRMQGGEVQYGQVPRGKKTAEAPSSTDLPFFQHHPDREYDDYYCGCFGWS